MLMNRRSSPVSSTRRSFSPGNWRSRSATTSSTVPPFAETSALPFVTWRSGVGIRTVTGIVVSLSARLVLEVGQRAIEGRERGLDLDVRVEAVVERVGRLEPIAGDGDDHGLVTRDHAGLDQLLGGGHRHTARRLGEDALRPRQQQHALDDLLVRGVLAEAARLLRHL